MKHALILGIVTLLAVGCKSTPKSSSLTQMDVISMTKAGLTDQEIINRIDETKSVFRLNADNVVALRKEGVSERVVNYMLDTYTRYAVAEERRQSSQPAIGFGFGYTQWH